MGKKQPVGELEICELSIYANVLKKSVWCCDSVQIVRGGECQ